MPQEEHARYGLWENGKRIEWFEDDMVGQINMGKVDVSSLFKSGESIETTPDYDQTFQRPPEFDERLKAIKFKISKF